MSSDEMVSFSLEVNVEKAYEDLRKVSTLLHRTLSLVRRYCGSEDINEAIDATMKFISWINQLRLTYAAFMAASGPLGWAMFGISLASTVAMTSEMAAESEP